MSYTEISAGGESLGYTVCNNPYTSYGFEGGMYDTPITGSDGSIIYMPTGEKGVSDGGPNSNDQGNFLNKQVYKDDFVSYMDIFGDKGNPLQDVPIPKGVYTCLLYTSPSPRD